MTKNLVLVGGGHAHMTVLLRLGDFSSNGHRVTVISPSPHHFYSGMGPGLLSGIYDPPQVRFNIRKMAVDGGASFIEDEAVRIDPAHRSITLRSGAEVAYDVASFNTGSRIAVGPDAAPSDRVVPVKPIINLYRARKRILEELAQRDLRIAVIGGGAAGVEIAANLWRLARRKAHRAEITLVGGERILGTFPERVRALAIESLLKRDVEVIGGTRARAGADGTVALSNGSSLRCDYVFMATGVEPTPLFSDSGIPTGEDGGLLVNSFLQSTAHPELFGGGDCIALSGTPLAKVGVFAVRQNPVLFHNLMAALEGDALHPFEDVREYMLIMNMGDGTGIVWKRDRVWDGRLAFLFKDVIDRRFMMKFQVSGERKESAES
ncbi:FAD-dependent oxidoreductase [Geomonas sp. RF6]|uniref:NAD(P)/FAD-dependent oxidoreductase n=1 Tax=Geomonas sp. RF6 TaxID=2897342 RepID=UPI001E46E3A7|nr:FAD-dependent oxidoreductase [Geomonas sp. RF6]UFS70200.1 FAD-dependent oxidoreductase [Geomonas sp. RF6]